MTSLPILVGLILGIAAASLIFAVAFTLLCCVILAGLKALPPRNPFSAAGMKPIRRVRDNRKPCRRFISSAADLPPPLSSRGIEPRKRVSRRFGILIERNGQIRLKSYPDSYA